MSQENVETAKRTIAAWNADDLDAFLAELDPEIEWHPSIEPALEGKATIYQGHDGARKAWDLGTVAGDWAAWCTLPGHKRAGMTLDIQVVDPPARTTNLAPAQTARS
jgi:hypothetical protein